MRSCCHLQVEGGWYCSGLFGPALHLRPPLSEEAWSKTSLVVSCFGHSTSDWSCTDLFCFGFFFFFFLVTPISARLDLSSAANNNYIRNRLSYWLFLTIKRPPGLIVLIIIFFWLAFCKRESDSESVVIHFCRTSAKNIFTSLGNYQNKGCQTWNFFFFLYNPKLCFFVLETLRWAAFLQSLSVVQNSWKQTWTGGNSGLL